MTPSTTERLVDLFLKCELPKSQWTHHAHLRVGLWHLMHYPPDQAMNLLRDRIKRYNVSVGGENTETGGYHETITQFYVLFIHQFLNRSDRSKSIDELAEELITKHGDKDLPLSYYTKNHLMSVNARLNWAEPDRKALVELERAS
jgi:hypothetical protein